MERPVFMHQVHAGLVPLKPAPTPHCTPRPEDSHPSGRASLRACPKPSTPQRPPRSSPFTAPHRAARGARAEGRALLDRQSVHLPSTYRPSTYRRRRARSCPCAGPPSRTAGSTARWWPRSRSSRSPRIGCPGHRWRRTEGRTRSPVSLLQAEPSGGGRWALLRTGDPPGGGRPAEPA